jgi:hypothetical protein
MCSAGRWHTKGEQREIGEEKEVKYDFFLKKYVSRLHICEKSSTFVAKMCVWTKWQTKMHEKLLNNIN